MYLKHFKLDKPPFTGKHNQDFYLHTGAIAGLVDLIIEDLAKPASVVIIAAEKGAGKTCIYQKAIDKLSFEHTIVSVGRKLKSSEDLLLKITRKLKIPAENADPSWLAATIRSCLDRLASCGKTIILAADDLQYISPDVVNAMLALSQLEKDDNAIVKIFATCENSYIMPADLKDTITFAPVIPELTPGEVASYIDLRLEVSSRTDSCLAQFTPEAKNAVAQITDGNPSRVNEICDQALTAAFNQGVYTIDKSLVETLSGKPAVETVARKKTVAAPENKPVAKAKIPAKTFSNYDQKLVAYSEPNGPKTKQFRQIRDNMLTGKSLGVFAVTSLNPAEGKTISAANLGVVFSELSGKKILLIEASLGDSQGLAEMFDYPQIQGLAQVITGQKTLAQSVQPTAISNLFILPAGFGFDNSVGVSKLNLIIEQAETIYDYIIIDAPDLQEIPRESIRNFPAKFVISTRLNHTRIDELQQMSQELRKQRASVAGVIVCG